MAYLSCAKDNEYPLLLIFNLSNLISRHSDSRLKGEGRYSDFQYTTLRLVVNVEQGESRSSFINKKRKIMHFFFGFMRLVSCIFLK